MSKYHSKKYSNNCDGFLNLHIKAFQAYKTQFKYPIAKLLFLKARMERAGIFSKPLEMFLCTSKSLTVSNA